MLLYEGFEISSTAFRTVYLLTVERLALFLKPCQHDKHRFGSFPASTLEQSERADTAAAFYRIDVVKLMSVLFLVSNNGCHRQFVHDCDDLRKVAAPLLSNPLAFATTRLAELDYPPLGRRPHGITFRRDVRNSENLVVINPLSH